MAVDPERSWNPSDHCSGMSRSSNPDRGTCPPASSMSSIDDAGGTTAQIRRVRRSEARGLGDARAGRAGAAPRATPSGVCSPMTPAPFRAECTRHAFGRRADRRFTSPQMPAPFQSPTLRPTSGGLELNLPEEGSPARAEDDKKRRRLWGWGQASQSAARPTVSP